MGNCCGTKSFEDGDMDEDKLDLISENEQQSEVSDSQSDGNNLGDEYSLDPTTAHHIEENEMERQQTIKIKKE